LYIRKGIRVGIFDSIAGQILGRNSSQNTLINALVAMVGNKQTGGLAGLMEKFAENGLGDIADSWVSKGENLPITPEQMKHALGDTTIGRLASQTGISEEEISYQLSTLLPQVVDKLTPNGKILQSDIMSKGVDLLKGLMK
jgi:uncharacterized protein YidB (DUF937 family)